jgi:hypothetical protein
MQLSGRNSNRCILAAEVAADAEAAAYSSSHDKIVRKAEAETIEATATAGEQNNIRRSNSSREAAAV